MNSIRKLRILFPNKKYELQLISLWFRYVKFSFNEFLNSIITIKCNDNEVKKPAQTI